MLVAATANVKRFAENREMHFRSERYQPNVLFMSVPTSDRYSRPRPLDAYKDCFGA